MKVLKRTILSSDIIGNDIKFYNDQETGTRHQSICGGLLSIVVVCLSLAVCIYFSLTLLIRENPKAYQISKYKDDTPKIEFSKSSIFFGTYLWSPKGPIDETILQYYASMRYLKSPVDAPRIYADYKMRKCSYENDFKDLEYLFEKYKPDIDKIWWCFGDMIINGTTIPQNDSKYVHPFTEHGMSSYYGDPIYFEVGAKRCQNSSENNNSCVPNEVISSYLDNTYYRMVLTDNNFDQNNYEQPVSRYLRQIDGAGSSSNYAANYINFNNVFFSTNDGLVFDKIETIDTYVMLDRVEVVSPIFAGSGLEGNVYMFRLEGQNSLQIYDRVYTRLQEVLANMGGVVKALFFISKILNYFLNSFTSKRNILEKVVMKYITLGGAAADRTFNASAVKANFKKMEDFSQNESPGDIRYFKKVQELSKPKVFSIDSNYSNKHIQDFDSLQESKSTAKNPPPKIVPITPLKKKPSLKQATLSQKSVLDSINMNFLKYLWLKIKKIIMFGRGEKIEIIENLEITNKIKKKIFNENTIYRLFFDLQKLKKILFEDDQIKAFDWIKADLRTSFSKLKLNKMEYLTCYESLAHSDDKLSRKLAKFLKEGVDI